jgi:hypothetical protein
VPFGDVVADADAGDVGQRVLLRDVRGAVADHEGELDLPVHLLGGLGQHHVVVRTDDAVRGLVEQDRLAGHPQARLGRVVGEVQPDADEVAHAAHARPEPRPFRRERQRGGVLSADALNRSGGQRLSGDVRHDAAEVANAALRIDQAGTFRAALSEPHQLHRRSPPPPPRTGRLADTA